LSIKKGVYYYSSTHKNGENMKEKIIELRALGYSYNAIAKQLGCSKGLISYHCGDGQKEKNKNRNKKCWKKLIHNKIEKFVKNKEYTNKTFTSTDKKRFQAKIQTFKKDSDNMNDITAKQFYEKYEGKEVRCYLTGEIIDITKPKTYEFDHKIPKSRGGDNSIDNLGICTKAANRSKYDMTEHEYIELCKKVVAHHNTK